MKNEDIHDPLYLKAVEAIDSGDSPTLERIINEHPQLLRDRLSTREEGYFKDPYLLWFIADNPIRIEKLPPNIIEIAKLLVKAVQREAPDTLQMQLNYTLGLVSTGRIPKECGVQIELMDLLIDAGANPGNGIGALAHGNPDAANHLLDRGGELTLPVAVCLDRMDDVVHLLKNASRKEIQLAVVACAFYGKADMLRFLIKPDLDLNQFPDGKSGFHSHATALHQAVHSGSLESVKILIEAGADPSIKDRVHDGTALEWADYMNREETDQTKKNKFVAIIDYLNKMGVNQ